MWSSLPQKLAIKIFSYVDSRAYLAECRLVCQSWHYPANKVILGKQIILQNNEDAMQLFKFIRGDPERGGLVKNLTLATDFQSYLVCELIHLVFTPSIEIFEGELSGYGVDVLFEINFNALNSPSSDFERLTTIPKPQKFTIMYFNTLLKFKKSLQRMSIELTNMHIQRSLDRQYIMDRLDGFETLLTLELKIQINDVTEIDKVLKHFNHLQKLSLELLTDCCFIMPQERVKTWTTNSIMPIKSLKTLSIKGLCFADVFEYLVYKYPHIQTIDAMACCVSANSNSHQSSPQGYHPNRIAQALVGVAFEEANFRNFNKAAGFNAKFINAITHNATAQQTEEYQLTFNHEQDHLTWIKKVDRLY